MKVLAITVLLFSLPAYPKTKHAPLPDSVIQAKTIRLVNKTGKQAILDSAYSEFEKWGRFRIVESKDSDLTAVFSRSAMDDPTDTGPGTRMDILARGEEDPVFEATSENTRAPGVYGLLIKDLSAKKCVDNFKKRLEK
jgi:hypothetical protein